MKKILSDRIRMVSSRAFTLTELMVVIAIIGILAVTVGNFDFERQTEIEKLRGFVQKFESIIRFAKSNAVTGRTTITGGCPDFVIAVSPLAITGSSVSFDDQGRISNVCGTVDETSVPAPMFGEPNSRFRIASISGYDKNDALVFRLSDETGTNFERYPIGYTGSTVGIFVRGTEMWARTMSCPTIPGCIDPQFANVVRLKLNLGYKQELGIREKYRSQDVFLDLRTGSLNVRNPTVP